jgi:hypothetical protein
MSASKNAGFEPTGFGLLSARRNLKYNNKKTSILEEIEDRISD